MTDAAVAKHARVICTGCGKRITETQASIFSGTADGGRERWHLSCWRYRLKAVEPLGRHTGAP